MIEKLIAMFEEGGITEKHLAGEALCQLDPADPGRVLRILPADVLVYVRELTLKYRSGRMMSNYGRIAEPEQVEAARAWIEANAPPERSEAAARA